MKKFIVIFLVILLIALCGCGTQSKSNSIPENVDVHSNSLALNHVFIDSVNMAEFSLPDYVYARGVDSMQYTIASIALSMASELSTDEISTYVSIMDQPVKLDFRECYMLVGGTNNPIYVAVTSAEEFDYDIQNMTVEQVEEFIQSVLYDVNSSSESDIKAKIKGIVGRDENKLIAAIEYHMFASSDINGASAEFNLSGYVALSRKDGFMTTGIFMSDSDNWMLDSAQALECNPDNPGTGIPESEYMAGVYESLGLDENGNYILDNTNENEEPAS